jgi:hypothetical protein
MKFFNLELCGLSRKDIQYREPVKDTGCKLWIFTNGKNSYERGINGNPDVDVRAYVMDKCTATTTYKSNCQTTK